jgi:hypothetical protein
MGMDMQGHLIAERRQAGKSRDRNGYVIADASSFYDSLIRMFGKQLAAQVGYHLRHCSWRHRFQLQTTDVFLYHH